MKKYTDEEKRLLKEWYHNKDVKKLVAFFFNRDKPRKDWFLPSKGQELIIKKVLYAKNGKMALLTAPTRYGKSQWLAIGICLVILFSKNKKIFPMAPTNDKTRIIRDYIVEGIMMCPELRFLLDTDKTGDDKLKKEVSKQRMTFKNGCIIQTMSLEGTGQRAMGSGVGRGGGVLLVDEIAECNRDALVKVVRMLSDNLEESSLFGLMNPWSKETYAYDLWCDEEYENIHITLDQAIEEGRLQKEFVEYQRRTLTDYEFTVMYKSKFPENSVMSVASYDDLLASSQSDIKEHGKYIDYGYDHARFGDDKCVLYRKKGNVITDRFVWSKKKSTYLAGEIGNLIIKDLLDGYSVNFSYDNALSGAGGVGDLIEERVEQKGLNKIFNLNPIDNAGVAIDENKFANIITELYFQIADNLDKIKIWNCKELFKDFSTRMYEYTTKGQRKLESKKTFKKRNGYSPDDGDAIAYCFYPDIGQIGESDICYDDEEEEDFIWM